MRWEQVAEWSRDPRLGVEVGARAGVFTAHMLRLFPELRMVAIDHWKVQPDRAYDEGHETYADWDFVKIRQEFDARVAPYAARVIVLVKDGVEAARDVEDGSQDFVFLDAGHGYSSIKADLTAWRPKVRQGGILCGHDYYEQFPGVCKAVDELGVKVILGGNSTWMVRC